jgi:hypothetical protein
MKQRIAPGAAALVLFICAAACSRESAAPRTSISAMDASAATVAGMPHGNHIPKFGGVVLMNGDLHFEVVARESGDVKIYFSDAARRELPASAVSAVKASIQRPGLRGEPVDLKISSDGEYWTGRGGFVDNKDTDLQIFFSYQGQQRTSDMPFFAAEAMKAAN